jgi:hypothetical protein
MPCTSTKLRIKGRPSQPEGGKWQPSAGKHKGKLQDDCSEDDDCGPAMHGPKGYAAGDAAPASAGPGSVAESASAGDGQSMGDAASEAASTSSAGGGGHDEDLAVAQGG